MGFEIERRYLIKNESWKPYAKDRTLIEQGYFLTDISDWIIRLRSIKGKFIITLKKHIKNFTNYEFEYEIPSHDGKIIMSKLKNKILKERYALLINERKWVVDCFKDKNYPLVIAEIELKSESEKTKLPNFLSQEITGNKNYSNFYLSKYPFEKWKDNLKNYHNH